MLETLYDNPLLTTLLPCVVAGAVLLMSQRLPRFPRVFGSVFAVEIAADAFLNGKWSPVPPSTALATAVGVTFVILGDLRYFVLLERAGGHARQLLRAVVWAFIVPVTTELVRWRMPNLASDDRSTFLLYEMFFFALAGGIRTFYVPRLRDARLALSTTQFELLQYGAWIAADVGIVVTGRDAFFGVRTVANLLYYVAFLPFTMWLLVANPRPSTPQRA